ncbi:Snf7 family protein [Kipferlia bialata]|uniref:Snf7 family protein n=1 Tax=Kipferlia bialata TaxID=797122 RepID=A0A9K3CN73_9EUKA|nr:Snf7 family protein [Kipferlia bialata]|eukprot:g887.t1
MGLFSKPEPKPTVQEVKRSANRSAREIEREVRKLNNECTKLEQKIRQCAQRGDQRQAALLAKELIRCRKMRDRSMGMKAQVSATVHSVTTNAAMNSAVVAMGSAAKVMSDVSAMTDTSAIRQNMQDFAKLVPTPTCG